MDIPILLYQMDIHFGNPQANIDKITTFLEEQDPEPGTLLILPELYLTGYDEEAIEELTTSKEHHAIAAIQKLSSAYNISIYGSIPILSDGEPYNTAILIDNGTIIDQYQKSHLFGPMGEKDLFRPGRKLAITKLGTTTLGMSICYDLRFPELYREQVKSGAELLLICAEWPIQRIQHWRALAKARAIENQCTVIACNRVGDDPDYHYGGNSMLIDSYGEIIAELAHDREDSIAITLSIDNITEFRNNFDTSIDRWI